MSVSIEESMPHSLGKERKRSYWVIILAVIFVAVLVFGATAWLAVQFVSHSSEHTKHRSITIKGNGEFTRANGVVGGNGTASDPYIISDWDIIPSAPELHASASAGILIQDTDAHFMIRNCHVHHGSTVNYDGIRLSKCVNGTLETNDCSDGFAGIRLLSSSDNTLTDNNCSNDFVGIVLGTSSNNALSNNNCTSNEISGIVLDSSSMNILRSNTCSNNLDSGIDLFPSSDNNTLSKNDCNSNIEFGIFLDSSENNTLSSNACCSNRGNGTYLFSSSANRLRNNNCSSNYHDGISLSHSSNSNEITQNLAYNNVGYGLNISFEHDYNMVSHNRIWNNTFIGNNGASLTHNASHVQACDNGMNNRWNSTEGYGNFWSDWTTPNSVPPWGIVDLPYVLDGSAGAKDYFPLTTKP